LWRLFIAVTSLLALLMAAYLGDRNFWFNMQPHYDISNMNTYSSVDPARMRGQELMDAGAITFVDGSHLDLKRSMGFKNQDTYCVAPITVGNENVTFKVLPSYDFWAVGMNCCGDKGDFKCGEYNNPNAHAGLRLMRDDQRDFFRLAVQQAESAFNIKAVHPVFVHFMQDPVAVALSYQEEGLRNYFVAMCLHFLLQLALVAMAVAIFQRLDSQTATPDQARGGSLHAPAKTVLL
jgi:hypothetical protein